MALLIAVLALTTGLVAVLRMPKRAFGPTGQESERVQALEEDVARLRQELNEVHERLDFAERILARVDERHRLGDRK